VRVPQVDLNDTAAVAELVLALAQPLQKVVAGLGRV
jgi:hypothetical protein